MRSTLRWSLPLVAAVLVAAAGCVSPPGQRVVTDKDNGSTVQVGIGDKITVALEANQTTGYGWETTGTLPSALKAGGTSYQQDAAAPGLVGAGGTARFDYTAVSAGEGTLAFSYVRPWEKGVPPTREFKIRIVVR